MQIISMNDTGMNDIFELWSQPWHALQHSLATSFGAEAAAIAPGNPQSTPARVAATPSSSWLVRALNVTAQTAQSRANR